MKKILLGLFIFILAFSISGCDTNVRDPKSMTKDEIVVELKLINNNLVNVWNDALVQISWFTTSGTNSEGNALDIDNTINKLELYYDDFKEDNTFIKDLDSNYKEVKDAWIDVYNELTTVYNEVNETKPVANEKVEYKENIDNFEECQIIFENAITALEQ